MDREIEIEMYVGGDGCGGSRTIRCHTVFIAGTEAVAAMLATKVLLVTYIWTPW